MTPVLTDLLGAGLITSLDVHAALTWARVAGEDRPDVLLAAALASRAVAAGHVCLDLGRIDDVTGDRALDEAGEGAGDMTDASVTVVWPEPSAWRESLLSSPLVHADDAVERAAEDDVRPLVVDGAGRLYLRRYWEHQERLAAGIRTRLVGPGAVEVDAVHLEEGLDRLFPAPDSRSVSTADVDAGQNEPPPEPDLQRRAAEGAVRSAFFVISGGPGTGKTSTVVKILALLVEQALARGESPPRIRMLAPTGKAAAHLSASVARSVSELDCAADVKAALPDAAATVHRALGAGGTPTRYRHDAAHPLPADVVLVDEASMVDLALMARLVAALPSEARLILLGDRDQLASVEAGAVLGDIAGGRNAEPEPAAPRPVIHLLRSHRFEEASALGALVRAIHEGDADAVLGLLDDETRPSVRRLDPADGAGLRRELLAGYGAFANADSAIDRLTALDRYRVLCAHRHGPFGVGEHNRLVEGLLAERGVIRPVGDWYAGRPVLIARNDYAAELYNGDVGLVVAESPEVDDVGRSRDTASLRALFRTTDGGERWLSPRRLGAAETVFAMTIHKSQGSELDAVLVVLPEQPSPVVSRELLYTAVSRARREVCLRASDTVIRDALSRRVERASGLREAIWR